ncbi:AAA family ATPase [Prevotella melaninogenica]|uniref:AAA family ATPase n=1 Tax=Prevotella melaninogenica TaxID=28132 RepID=UPI001BA5C8C5|nr:AAA family ATPase [Prevotella melaninogenica]QUB67065.1 ATP-binding protein [Prevotella melaninogenica]
MLENSYISSFIINNLWGKYNIGLRDLDPKMNILVGINGCGKTTLLDEIYKYYIGPTPRPMHGLFAPHIYASPDRLEESTLLYMKSLDNYTQLDKRKKVSALTQALEYVIYQNKESFSFFNYRIRMIDFPDEAYIIKERIQHFFDIIDKLFEDTNKKITIQDSRLVFQQNRDIVEVNQLSSGEKQLLLILLNVFLLKEKKAVILMDEPEISLHISWQYHLLDILTELNPQAQFIITTHSPSIFGDGWGDKVIYFDDITEKC